MSLIVNVVEIENVICNSVNIDTIIYNGVTVFKSKDKLVLNVSSVSNSAGSNGVYVYIASGEMGCTATYNNETKTISPNTQGEINFVTETSGITGDLSIEGDFTMVEIPNIGDGHDVEDPGYIINQIKQWYKKINNIPENFFYCQNIDFDINLPDNIIRIERLAFDNTTISNSSLTFKNLEYCYTFGPRNTFFNNATNNGDVWSINGFALAPYGSNASSRTDTFTIPNGTKSMAAGLFYYYSSPGFTYFNLSNIIFPTDGLLTEIPDNFCTDAVNLTSIEFPSSITKIGRLAFGQASQTIKLNEITFNESENVIIEFPPVGKDSGAFFIKTANETTVNAENVSVLNYDWSGDNRTVTFYKLDKTTIIPKLETPTITLNGNILTINSYDSNSAEFEISAFNNIIQTSNTVIDLTQYVPTPSSVTQTYEIKVRSLTSSSNYAASSPASVTYTIEAEGGV